VRLPSVLLPHSITVRHYQGTGPYGEVFGDPIVHQAFVEGRRRLVVSASGEEVISETTVYTGPDTIVPVGSQVTVWAPIPRTHVSPV
jgi:hypothetical protein